MFSVEHTHTHTHTALSVSAKTFFFKDKIGFDVVCTMRHIAVC